MTNIYTLSDPDTKEIRYVGKTVKSLEERLNNHVQETRMNGYGKRTYKNNWIKGLLLIGKLPVVEALDIVDDTQGSDVEIYWIAQVKAWGFRLTNMTAGGDGNNNQVFTEESRRKRSLMRTGYKLPQTTKDKIRDKHLGKVVKESTRLKLRLCNLGKKYSKDTHKKSWKAIEEIDINGNLIKEYEYLRKAAKELDCRAGSIANVCQGRCKTACGRRFRYKAIEAYEA